MRYQIPERSFIFDVVQPCLTCFGSGKAEDGVTCSPCYGTGSIVKVIHGFPLTIAHERTFLRDGTFAILSSPAGRPAEELYAASLRYVAAALRRDEEFVAKNFSPGQLGGVLKAVFAESVPKPPEGNGGPEAKRP